MYAARANLSLENVKNFPIPLPPLEEQDEIVKEIDLKFSELKQFTLKIDDLLKMKELLLNNLKTVNNSILSNAFSGKLVN